ncbi:PREDICTED: uncharacterized protein LOC101366938 [Odobenus rosmarus divergens]|uniref:Uncharacterized protein LOC101366938 n=1 Tax=Odobenus rosmarus divergens TaxID=9708 RepID=A0A9B0GAA7_ODORO
MEAVYRNLNFILAAEGFEWGEMTWSEKIFEDYPGSSLEDDLETAGLERVARARPASSDALGRRGARACSAGGRLGSRVAAICCAAARGSRQIRVSWLRVTWSIESKQRRGGNQRQGAAAAAASRAAAAFRKLQAVFLPSLGPGPHPPRPVGCCLGG